MKNIILLIEDEAKVEARVKEVLADYQIETLTSTGAALDYLRSHKCDLVIIDHDLKKADGLRLLREIRLLSPRVKIVMLSASNDVQLAVAAVKMGAAEFLKKPIAADQFRGAIEKTISSREEVASGPAGSAWLQGESPGLKKMYADITNALASDKNILLFGERGIAREEVAAFIHSMSPRKNRLLKCINLLSFRRQNQEAPFWATVQELTAEPPGNSLLSESDLSGTLYLENIEALEDNFKASIFDFFKTRRGELLLVAGIADTKAVPPERAKNFFRVDVPPLRDRREDLPQLLIHYLNYYSMKHNKRAAGFSAGLLSLLMLYDYPGNYRELECLIEQGVLSSSSEMLDLKDIALDLKGLSGISLKKAAREGKSSLEEVKNEFEAELYGSLLAGAKGDLTIAARFLDVPRSILAERIGKLSN